MKKLPIKVFFIAAFVLVSAGVFAQVSNEIFANDRFESSDGQKITSIYRGKYCGQQSVNEFLETYEIAWGVRPDMSRFGKALTKAQWDIVRQALDRWAHSTGDTYTISLGDGWVVIVEFTSATQYTYWTFR